MQIERKEDETEIAFKYTEADTSRWVERTHTHGLTRSRAISLRILAVFFPSFQKLQLMNLPEFGPLFAKYRGTRYTLKMCRRHCKNYKLHYIL